MRSLRAAPVPIQSLGTLPGQPSSNGLSINSSDWIVGQSNDEAFVWTPQTGMQPVGFLPGGNLSELECINNADVAVGGATPGSATVAHAAIWDPVNGLRGLTTTIVNRPSGPGRRRMRSRSARAEGMSPAWAALIGVERNVPPPDEHAFVLSNGSLTVIPDPGIFIQPSAINSSGEVAGEFLDANNKYHGFVFEPGDGIQGHREPRRTGHRRLRAERSRRGGRRHDVG